MNTISMKIPTSWNQLTTRQILFVCRLFLANLTLQNFRIRAFCHFTEIKPFRKVAYNSESAFLFYKGKTMFTIEAQEMIWFLKSVDYLTTDSNLTVNLFPSFHILWKRFRGPARKCFDITFLEFFHAEFALFMFGKTKEVRYLEHLCSILYRSSRLKPFNEGKFKSKSRWFKLLSTKRKYTVYIFYAGCRNALFNAYPNLQRKNTTSSSRQQIENPASNLKKIVYQLTLGDITKKREIENTPVWQAFDYLSMMVEQNEKK